MTGAMFIGDPPCADSTSRFSRRREATRRRDRTPIPIFSSGACPRSLWRQHARLKPIINRLRKDAQSARRILSRVENQIHATTTHTQQTTRVLQQDATNGSGNRPAARRGGGPEKGPPPIGRAAGRGRGEISGGAGSLKKKK